MDLQNSQPPQPSKTGLPPNSLQRFYRVPLDDRGIKHAIIRRTFGSDKEPIRLDAIVSFINKINGLDDPPRLHPNVEEIPLCPCCRSDSEPWPLSQNKLLRAASNHPQLYQSMFRLPKAVRIRPLTLQTTTTPPQTIHHPQAQQTTGDISQTILPPQPQQAAAKFLARLNSSNGANTHHGQHLLHVAPQTPNLGFTTPHHIPPTGPHGWSPRTPADNAPVSPSRYQPIGLPNLCLGIEQFNKAFKSLDDPIPMIDRILEVNSFIEKNSLWRKRFPPLNPALYLQHYNPAIRQPTRLERLQQFQGLERFTFHFETYRKRVAQKRTRLKGPFQKYLITPQDVFEPDFMPPLVASDEETSRHQSFQQHNLHKQYLQRHAMQQQAVQQHAIQKHATQQHSIQQNSIQQHAIQQRTIPSRTIPLQAYQPHVLQPYAIQKRAIQKHSLRKYAIRQHAIRQHAIRQDAIRQQALQQQKGFQQQGFQQQVSHRGLQPQQFQPQALHQHASKQQQVQQQQVFQQQVIQQQASQREGPPKPQHKHPIFQQPLSPPPHLLNLNPIQDPHAFIDDQNRHSGNEFVTTSGGSWSRKKKAGLSIVEARLAKQREGVRKSSRFRGARDDN